MQVLVNTDSAIHGGQGLNGLVEATVTGALQRYGDQVTTVQVHLSDSNSHKKGDNDKRCMMEARLGGHGPVAVAHDAGTVEEAIDGCAEKLVKTIDRTMGRIGDHKGNMPTGGPPGV